MSPLEKAVSMALFAAKQLERAFHDAGPWTVNVEGVSYPASRFVKDDRVVFVAIIESTGGAQSLTLMSGDEAVASRIEVLPEGGSQCSWHMVAPRELVGV